MAKVEVGAGPAVWGSFQPLFEQEPNNPGSQEFVVTSWTQTELGGSKAVLYGVPVLAASVLLVLCAALVLVDAWLPGRVARAVGVASVGAVLVQGERVRVPVEERPVVHRLPDGEERSGPA